MTKREVVLVDGARSPFGKLGGGLRTLAASQIASQVVRGLAQRTDILERGTVDTLVAGMALPDVHARTAARYVALDGGLPIECSTPFVEMQCGSAVTGMNHAAWRILAGMSEVAIAGGMESYSTMPAKFSTSQPPFQLMPPTAVPASLTPNKDRDTDMVANSDLMAETWGITRQECDEFAVASQQRLAKAYAMGIIGPEIVPCVIPAAGKMPQQVVDTDEHPRPGATYEAAAKLRPVYEGGVTTAANSSGRNDGAAFILMMTAEKAKELGYTPFARWLGCAHVGCQENLMGIGASYASLELLQKTGLSVGDMDVFECNEAFASQNLCVIKDMEKATGKIIDREKWNPNGGAIAIGHPNGASGARITWFAMKQLEKSGGRYGLISVCCGGGQGTAALIENLRT